MGKKSIKLTHDELCFFDVKIETRQSLVQNEYEEDHMWDIFNISLIHRKHQGEDEKDIKVGSMRLSKCELRSFADILDVFDRRDSTEHFMNLFADNQLKKQFKEKIYQKYLDDGSIFGETYILEHAFINEKYRGNGLFELMLNKTLSSINATSIETALLLYAFPTQYRGKLNTNNIKEFTKDLQKLCKFYEDLGFLKLDDSGEGCIFLHNTAYRFGQINDEKSIAD